MGHDVRVVLEADSKGRLTISTLDDQGLGHGHRFCGPRCVNDVISGNHAQVRASKDLDDEDVAALRGHLRDWDGITLAGQVPADVLALSEALDRYLIAQAARVSSPGYGHLPHHQLRIGQARHNLLAAINAAIVALVPGEHPAEVTG